MREINKTKTSPKEIRVATYRHGQEPRKDITMNTTTSTNSAVRFTIDFFKQTITGTKASFAKAGKGFGPEYEELTAKMAAHPTFTLTVKEQKHKATSAKKTYEGMDFKFMEDYIATFEDATLAHEYESVKEMAKKCGTKAYPLTKKWFLGKFSDEESGFDMDAARKDIANFRIAQATQLLTNVSSDNAEQTNEVA